jgi:hypothetical protein
MASKRWIYIAVITPLVFRGDKIYGVFRDDLDVQYVLRLRILGMPDTT